jgi:hypothetical protein
MYMVVPISKFRREIFSLTEAALQGNVVEFVHKGVKFRVTPERINDKLSKLTALEVINPEYDLNSAMGTLRQEMQDAWEHDWREI